MRDHDGERADMTDEQIKAIFQGCGDYRCVCGVIDGVRYVSNGHVMIPSENASGKELEAIDKPWRLALGRMEDASVVKTVGYYQDDRKEHFRTVLADDISVDLRETYLRMVNASEWRFSGIDDPLIGMRDGKLVGLVMPMKKIYDSEKKACQEPSDEVLVAEFACEENGWAGESQEKMQSRMAELDSEIRDAQRRISELECEIEEWKREQKDLRIRLREKVPC